ncbi:hypothetical protein F9C11_21640 [Amycolatopsis sp. VS8301801F10]|uniref:hypothetical protein n=1 Tax=Amycolatopsis sp. VS8301801F10 TaxID=2652442 RepID=UPI0038FBEA44
MSDQTPPVPAPRTLLGWTVPSHVDMVENDEGTRLTCTQDRAYVLASRSIDGDSRALKFLFDHAHGQVVEHREDDPYAGWSERQRRALYEQKPPPVESAAEHQPAADSEDDKLAEIGRRVMDDWTREIAKLTAERDQLQARIKKALAACGGTDDERRIARILRGEEDR